MMSALITVGSLEARVVSDDETGRQSRLDVVDDGGRVLATFYDEDRAVHAYTFMVAVSHPQPTDSEVK